MVYRYSVLRVPPKVKRHEAAGESPARADPVARQYHL
jgi:hypothetical protein